MGRFVCLFLEAGRAGGAGGTDRRSSQTAPLPYSLQTTREHVKLVVRGLGQVAPQSELVSPEQHK